MVKRSTNEFDLSKDIILDFHCRCKLDWLHWPPSSTTRRYNRSLKNSWTDVNKTLKWCGTSGVVWFTISMRWRMPSKLMLSCPDRGWVSPLELTLLHIFVRSQHSLWSKHAETAFSELDCQRFPRVLSAFISTAYHRPVSCYTLNRMP